MFEIPKWGDDIPKSNVNFGKGTGKSPKNKNKVKTADATSPTPQKKSKNQNKHNEKNKTLNNKIKKNVNNVLHTSGNKTIITKKRTEKNSKSLNSKTNKNNLKKEMKNSFIKTNGIQSQSDFIKKPMKLLDNSTTLLSKTKMKSKKRKQKDITPNVIDEDTGNEEFPQMQSKVKKKKFNSVTQAASPDISESVENNITDPNKPVKTKVSKKKLKIKMMLQMVNNRNQIKVSSNNLRQRMLEKLKAAQFRFLNEKLYTTSGSESLKLFQSDPEAFHTYHQGYQLQVKKWPVNPLDLIVKRISKLPKTHIVADMGCGEGALSTRVPHKVRSFDLVSTKPEVEACDMAHTPLLSASVDIAVYCLALMGTELTQYLLEANRVLKMGGHLLIAEVESRFDKVETFTEEVQRLGFKLKNLDKSHTVFFFMEFTKIRDPPAKKSKLPHLTLRPCLYKRR